MKSLIVLLIVIIQLLHVQIALSNLLQCLVISLLHLLILDLHEQLLKSSLLLNELHPQTLSLLSYHG